MGNEDGLCIHVDVDPLASLHFGGSSPRFCRGRNLFCARQFSLLHFWFFDAVRCSNSESAALAQIAIAVPALPIAMWSPTKADHGLVVAAYDNWQPWAPRRRPLIAPSVWAQRAIFGDPPGTY